MTLDQLEAFLAVVETGSFKAASLRLSKSQPAVSMAIKHLESEFEFDFFSRHSNRANLTPQGEAFFKKVQPFLLKAQSLETFGKQLGMGQEPQIRLAVDYLCPMSLTFELLKQCDQRFPATQVYLSSELVGGVMERLLDRDADIGFTPTFEEGPEIESIPLIQVKMIPVASPDYPLAKIKPPFSQDDLEASTQIIVRGSSIHSPEKSFGVLPGVKNWTVNDPFTKKELILNGLGWGGLPDHLMTKELNEGLLVPLDIEATRANPWVYVVRRTDRPIGPVAWQIWENFSTRFQQNTRKKLLRPLSN